MHCITCGDLSGTCEHSRPIQSAKLSDIGACVLADRSATHGDRIVGIGTVIETDIPNSSYHVQFKSGDRNWFPVGSLWRMPSKRFYDKPINLGGTMKKVYHSDPPIPPDTMRIEVSMVDRRNGTVQIMLFDPESGMTSALLEISEQGIRRSSQMNSNLIAVDIAGYVAIIE